MNKKIKIAVNFMDDTYEVMRRLLLLSCMYFVICGMFLVLYVTDSAGFFMLFGNVNSMDVTSNSAVGMLSAISVLFWSTYEMLVVFIKFVKSERIKDDEMEKNRIFTNHWFVVRVTGMLLGIALFYLIHVITISFFLGQVLLTLVIKLVFSIIIRSWTVKAGEISTRNFGRNVLRKEKICFDCRAFEHMAEK